MPIMHRHSRAELIEELAALEHERWSHWQRFVHGAGKRLPDGSLLLPAELITRWDQQIATRYNDLSEKEKQSDREQVMKYFPLLERWISDPS